MKVNGTAVTRGTNDNDLLIGNDRNNRIYGKGGDDQLLGLGGNDLLSGGRGDDTLLGGEGNDVLFGDDSKASSHNHSHGHYNSHGRGWGGHSSGGDDTLDGGAGNDLVFGGRGNDRGIYNVTENLNATDRYDGGAGIDTLVLELTQEQWLDPAVQNDLVAYQAFQQAHTNPHTGKADGHAFSFNAFDLTVSRWENIEVNIVDGDNTPPTISAVSLPDSAMNVGDVVTVTLTVDDDLGDTYSNVSGTVGGFTLSNLTRIDSTTYSAQFTVTEGGSDLDAGADIPVSITLDDSGGNTSATFTTPISQASDAIDANSPATPNAPNLAQASDSGISDTDNLTSDTTPTFNGTAEANSTVQVFSSVDGVLGTTIADGSGNWSFIAGTLSSGAHNITATASDAAGNTSSVSSALVITIDANSPSISAVSIPNTTMNVGDAVTVTIIANEAGLSLSSGTINGVAVTGFSDDGGGNYSAIYTVAEGHADQAAGTDIPVSFVLEDAAANTSATFNTAISQTGDTIDANSPTLSSSSPGDEASGVALDANILLNFNENIALGSGNIVISDGTDTITIDVASHGGQLSISGGQLTINPTADLANNGANYNVQVDSTAIVDSAGNAYAGIADSSTLDFTTAAGVDTSIVVFDMIAGTSSEHSSRSFDAAMDYTIYIVVNSTSNAITNPITPWTNAGVLTSDDQVILVGSGTPIVGAGGGNVASTVGVSSGFTWQSSVAGLTVAALFVPSGAFQRNTAGGGQFASTLWATSTAARLGFGGFTSALPTPAASTQSLS